MRSLRLQRGVTPPTLRVDLGTTLGIERVDDLELGPPSRAKSATGPVDLESRLGVLYARAVKDQTSRFLCELPLEDLWASIRPSWYVRAPAFPDDMTADAEVLALVAAARARFESEQPPAPDPDLDGSGVPFACLLPRPLARGRTSGDAIDGPGPLLVYIARTAGAAAAVRAFAAGCTWEHQVQKIADDKWSGVTLRQVKDAVKSLDSPAGEPWLDAARLLRSQLQHDADSEQTDAAAAVVDAIWKQHGYPTRTALALVFPGRAFATRLARLAQRRPWPGCRLLAECIDDPDLAAVVSRL